MGIAGPPPRPHRTPPGLDPGPADAVSTPGPSENTRSTVGERRRLREQRKRRLVTQTKKTRHRWRAFHSVDDEGELALAGLKAT